GVGQVITQPVRVSDGDHFVMDTVHDEDWLTDALEVREALAREMLPVTKRRHLGGGNLGSGGGLPILLPLREPSNKGLACCLARLCQRKEDLRQDRVSSKLRIPEVVG